MSLKTSRSARVSSFPFCSAPAARVEAWLSWLLQSVLQSTKNVSTLMFPVIILLTNASPSKRVISGSSLAYRSLLFGDAVYVTLTPIRLRAQGPFYPSNFKLFSWKNSGLFNLQWIQGTKDTSCVIRICVKILHTVRSSHYIFAKSNYKNKSLEKVINGNQFLGKPISILLEIMYYVLHKCV